MFFPMAGFFSDKAQAVVYQIQNSDENKSTMGLSNIRSVGVNNACARIIQQTGLNTDGVFADPPVHIHRHIASLVLHRVADGLAGLCPKFNSGKNTFFKWISQGIFKTDLLGFATGFLTKNHGTRIHCFLPVIQAHPQYVVAALFFRKNQ